MKQLKICLLLLCIVAINSAVSAQDTIRVKVMTYNLRFGELSSLEDLASQIKSFKPDFVALEEVDINPNRNIAPHQKGKNFINELANKTGMFGLYGKTVNFSNGGYYGIGMLSKYPYITVQKTMLANPKNEEPRALLQGLFEVGKDTIIFAATHLDVKDAATRDLQAQFICNNFEKSNYPVVIGGDFNARPNTNTIEKIMKKNWFNATNDDLSFPAWNPSIKIDYIFCKPMKGWKVIKTQTVQSQLSDHLPVITELEYIRTK